MACHTLPSEVDTVIVGSGPSALILSFILNGNIPYYDSSKSHLDPILQKKLLQSPSLLDIDIPDLTSHFAASRLSYSTQALPVNVLLDTLLRPLADTNPGEYESCVEWRYDASRRVSHVVVGNTSQPGGQWSDNPVAGSWGIGSLSYAEMLSLPGYSFEQYFQSVRGVKSPDFYRPSRREVAEYVAAYPGMVGIADSVFTNINVGGVSRVENGFVIGSHNLQCRHLVLASGVFSEFVPPPPLLRPLIGALPDPGISKFPLLVIGSGFTAADIILSSPPNRRIVHIFRWDAEHPSPLQFCHPQAYPEYASVYRHMKLAASNYLDKQAISPLKRKISNSFFDQQHWNCVYEGLPNTSVKSVELHDHNALVELEGGDGTSFEREISGLEYVVGRRGSLAYLGNDITAELLGSDQLLSVAAADVSSRTLRAKVEDGLEIAPDVFAIGSLTGDSLIRFAFGGCVFTAREIIKREHRERISLKDESRKKDSHTEYAKLYRRADLDVGKKGPELSVGLEVRKCELWPDLGLRAGGCVML